MYRRLTSREIAGIIIWWSEGTKSRRDKRWKTAKTYPIEVTNTNSEIIKLFLDFLRKDLKIDNERIYLQLQIHKGDDREYLEDYWSKLTKIPRRSFQKTIIRPAGNKIGKSKGTCKIRFSDKDLYLNLEKLLAAVLDEIRKKPTEVVKTLTDYNS